MIKLEDGTIYYLINGVPQQRGAVAVVVDGDGFVGLRFVGSERFLVAPVHFSEWEDGTGTPYPTRQALFDALAAIIFESNASGIPDAPVDASAYVRKNGAWVLLNPEVAAFLNYSNTALAAPFSTSSLTFVIVNTHTFTAVDTETWIMRVIWDYAINATSQRMEFDVRLNGVSIYTILKEAKDNNEVSLISAFATLGTDLPLIDGVNTVELYARKDNGNDIITMNIAGFSTERKI